MEQANRVDAQRVSGIPNLTFDLVSLMHNKLEAVAALEVYLADAREVEHHEAIAFLEFVRNTDLSAVQTLRRLLREELDTQLEAAPGELVGDPDRGGDLTPNDNLEDVDLESDLSFPASDPPTFNRTTAEP